MPNSQEPNKTADRYETRCVKCGTVLKDINRPEPQTCKCGDITAHHCNVYERARPKGKKNTQAAMFDSQTDYLE